MTPTTSPPVGPPPSHPISVVPNTPEVVVPSPYGAPKTPVKQPIYSAAPSGSVLFVLINGLHVRAKPDLHAKSLGKLKLNDEVYFANDVTENTSSIHLATGEVVTKPWVKIKTKRGTIGWVHGSGVDYYKRKPSSVVK